MATNTRKHSKSLLIHKRPENVMYKYGDEGAKIFDAANSYYIQRKVNHIT